MGSLKNQTVMKRKKIVILPKLNDAGGNLSKKWFVYYSVRDPRTDKMERFKDHVGLSHPDESVRRERADKIIQELTVKLKKGWTPCLDDTEAIYEDQLQYKHVAYIYGTQKENIVYRSNTYILHYWEYLSARCGKDFPFSFGQRYKLHIQSIVFEIIRHGLA